MAANNGGSVGTAGVTSVRSFTAGKLRGRSGAVSPTHFTVGFVVRPPITATNGPITTAAPTTRLAPHTRTREVKSLRPRTAWTASTRPVAAAISAPSGRVR